MQVKRPLEIELNILLITLHGKPAIQLRKTISQPFKIQQLTKHALENGEIPAIIRFKDPLLAMIKLKALGLID